MSIAGDVNASHEKSTFSCKQLIFSCRYTFPTYAAALISQREAKGPYNSIQHLFSYNELEPQVIKRMCSLIIQEETRAKAYKYRVTPVMEAKVREHCCKLL